MEAINEILANIAAAEPALVPILYALFIAAGLDLLSGLWAATQTPGGLRLEYVAEFIKSHIALKVGPIMLQLIAGVAVGGTDSAAGVGLVTFAGAQAALYLASVVGSIRGNVAEGQAQEKFAPTSVGGVVIAGELADAPVTPGATPLPPA